MVQTADVNFSSHSLNALCYMHVTQSMQLRIPEVSIIDLAKETMLADTIMMIACLHLM